MGLEELDLLLRAAVRRRWKLRCLCPSVACWTVVEESLDEEEPC